MRADPGEVKACRPGLPARAVLSQLFRLRCAASWRRRVHPRVAELRRAGRAIQHRLCRDMLALSDPWGAERRRLLSFRARYAFAVPIGLLPRRLVDSQLWPAGAHGETRGGSRLAVLPAAIRKRVVNRSKVV